MSDAETAALMNRLEREIPPMGIANAERFMREVKAVFDEHDVTFFLRQGTCLGAVRDGALIPWDDDLDLGSIIGLHGFTEDVIAPIAEALRATGSYVEVAEEGLYTSVKVFKYRIRIDWQCYRVVKGTIAHYPGVPFPVSLFEELTPVDFIGDQYLVPSPPDDLSTVLTGIRRNRSATRRTCWTPCPRAPFPAGPAASSSGSSCASRRNRPPACSCSTRTATRSPAPRC